MLFLEADFATFKKTKGKTKMQKCANENNRQRLLVVEDDPNIRRLNTEILIYSGYQVDAAENGLAAWYALQLNHYDLMITDNNMPKLTGVQLLQKMHASGVEMPVIMATGALPSLEFSNDLLQTTLILKPYSYDELLKTVKNVLSVNRHGTATPPPDWRGVAVPLRVAA
jgi:DNA-binding response OmpR family regulator